MTKLTKEWLVVWLPIIAGIVVADPIFRNRRIRSATTMTAETALLQPETEFYDEESARTERSIFDYKKNGIRVNMRIVPAVNQSLQEPSTDNDDKFPDFPYREVGKCIMDLSLTCIQKRVARYIDVVGNLREIYLFGKAVKLVKVSQALITADRQDNKRMLLAPGEWVDRSIDNFFDNFALRITLPRWNGKKNQIDVKMDDSGDQNEGRGKMKKGGKGGKGCKKMMMMMLMGLKMKMMGMIGMAAMKGMFMSGMSLMISKMMLLQKLMSLKGGMGMFGGGKGGYGGGGGGGGGQYKEIVLLTKSSGGGGGGGGGGCGSSCAPSTSYGAPSSSYGAPPADSYGAPPPQTGGGYDSYGGGGGGGWGRSFGQSQVTIDQTQSASDTTMNNLLETPRDQSGLTKSDGEDNSWNQTIGYPVYKSNHTSQETQVVKKDNEDAGSLAYANSFRNVYARSWKNYKEKNESKDDTKE